MALLALALQMFSASADDSFHTYTYSNDAKFQYSPNAFYPVQNYESFGSADLNKPQDLKVDKTNGDICIADTGDNRVVVLKSDFSLKKILTQFTDGSGKSQTFSGPKGVFIDNQYLYVCDTGNKRIVIFDKAFRFVSYVNAPSASSMPDGFVFAPAKMAVDMVGRLNIICDNNTMGIVCMDRSGVFEGFVGAIKVQLNPAAIFWRNFMTEEQIEQTDSFVPSPYSNIAVDSDGFIYATASSFDDYTIYDMVKSKDKSDSYSPVKRFSPSGDDILKRNGVYQPVGELNFTVQHMNNSVGASAIDDVATTSNGVYSLMDSRYDKIFTYDGDGNLLYAFGGKGAALGQFSRLSAIAYCGQNDSSMLALDSETNSITLLTKTEYGLDMDRAINLTNRNNSGAAVEAWRKILKQNSNFDLAYLQIGKSLIKSKDYTDAMHYLYLANSTTYYSKAFQYDRADKLKNVAIFIPIILILLFTLIVYGFKKAKIYNQKHLFSPDGKRTVREQIVYAFYVIFHPFDGFWDLKNQKRGGPAAGTVILAIVTLSFVVAAPVKGYLFRGTNQESYNLFTTALGVVLPVLLWTVGNWCLTSLMDGKGRMVEIYTATCYSILPLAFVVLPMAIISNFLILDETMILNLVMDAAILWVVILFYAAMVSTHAYTHGRAFLVCLLTIIVIAFILFIGLVFFSVCGKLFSFLANLYKEITFRL